MQYDCGRFQIAHAYIQSNHGRRFRWLDVYAGADAAALAAAYACGLARNHGFADGNRRTAWVAARLFLADKYCRLRFDPADAAKMMEMVAAGLLEEVRLAEWFRQRLVE